MNTIRGIIIVLTATLTFLVFYTPGNVFSYKKLFSPVVKIVAVSDDTPEWSGTGFLISPDGFIVTCNHVVEKPEIHLVENKDKKEKAFWWSKKKKEDKSQLLPAPKNAPEPKGFIRFKKEKPSKLKIKVDFKHPDHLIVRLYGIPEVEFKSKIIWQNRVFDVSIIKITSPVSLPYLKLSNKEPKIGQKLYVAGHPAPLSWAGYSTTLVGTMYQIDAIYRYAIRDTIAPGISGSPVVDENYNVVCIADSVFVNTETGANTNTCIPIKAVQWAIETLNLRL